MHDEQPTLATGPVTPSQRGTRRRTRTGARTRRDKGQIVVLFAGALIALLALCACVLDVAWYWTNNLRIQRAADAAALAGVVWLPGNPGRAFTVAQAEATKNGYATGTEGVVVTPSVDPNNNRRLRVAIAAPVGTFFARVVGITSWPAAQTAAADYVLPVPMGSPDNYYGVGYWVKPETTTVERHRTYNEDSPRGHPSEAPGTAAWRPNTPPNSNTLVSVVGSEDATYAWSATNNSVQQWGRFGLLGNLGADEAVTDIVGIQVTLTDVRLSANCSSSTNRVLVQLSWDGGTSWTTSTNNTRTGSFSGTGQNSYTIGDLTSTSIWTASGLDWDAASAGKLANDRFRVRLTASKGCGTSSTEIRVDEISVQVRYGVDQTYTTTTTVLVDDAPVPPPPGQPAITRPQKIWGAMQSQGAPSVQGDAFMTKYDTRTSVLNAVSGTEPDVFYAPEDYYNYGVEIPAGGGGTLWIFDPGFCDSTSTAGTGEYWTVGGSNGYGSSRNQAQPISAFYDLFSTNETMLDESDDVLVASTGNDYRRAQYEDHAVFGVTGDTTSFADCSGLGWHNSWVQVATGLAAGTYRLHTYSTDVGSPNDQNNSTALNSFALYASSASGTPKIYGIGAMQAYVRLPSGRTSEFYFAQIDAVHAGKTMVINLWDPGDTGSLSASLEILQPTGSGFTPVQFDYSGTAGSSAASSCTTARDDVWSVTTNTGGTSLFNGCWLTMEVPIPADYTAPRDPASGEDGWWKIRYTMGSQSGGGATDMTTWKVDIRGNPVHLVTP